MIKINDNSLGAVGHRRGYPALPVSEDIQFGHRESNDRVRRNDETYSHIRSKSHLLMVSDPAQ